jgi:hypothetical protein
MANEEEGITFDLEKNAQVNRLISSYDPKLRLREKILFLKKVGNKMHITKHFYFFWPIINKVRFLLFLLINLS